MFANNTFFWDGEKDLEFYNKEFEAAFLQKSTEEYYNKSL